MSNYHVTVADYPSKQLVGMKVRTSMKNSHQDCPALWQHFGPRIGELLGNRESYGVSVMINEEEFYYWAVVEWEPLSPLPEGMERIDIPAGKYAKCTAPSLNELADVYMYIYGGWPESQDEYTFDEKKACIELYRTGWQPEDALDVYMPLKAK